MNKLYKDVRVLRDLSAEKLRNNSDTIVLQEGDQPLAVLVPYAVYLEMQDVCLLHAIRTMVTGEPIPSVATITTT